LMKSLDLLTLEMVGLVSVAGGYLLYAFLLKYSASIENIMDEEQPTSNPSNTNPRTMVISCAIAAIAVTSCGFSWHTMAVTGASKIQTLPSTCDVYANNGQWMSLHGCDEGPRGEEYRKFGVSTVSTCSAQNEVYVWGWNDQKSSSHCRFKQRDPKSLKKHLKDRTIYFVGDSITRYIYHSFCRQLGISDSGMYNATQGKHQNVSQKIGDITVEFIWAGFATDVVDAVGNLTLHEKKSDLVVLGGGAWDKLWKYKTDEEKEALKSTVGDLAKGIQNLRKKVPVVWTTPTRINTPALPSEEKQQAINEDEMKIIRRLYESEGVLSSSTFVIDGESFTSGRVSESYDGVHYPHNVYSAGAQILCNSMDWLLPIPNIGLPKPPNQPGSMSDPLLGFYLLCFAAAGIFLFDGFMGFSYLAAIIVPSVSPKGLHYEAFSVLHRNNHLPALEMKNLPPTCPVQDDVSIKGNSMVDDDSSKNEAPEEIVSLIEKER